ncbi:MAG: PspC domain-containing protein [Chloroflexota bacterium]
MMAEPSDRRRLRRSRDERLLFGVCSGLAEYFGADPNLVRIGFVLAVLVPPLSAVSLIGYVLLAVILPEEGSEHLSGRERVQHNLEGLRTDVSNLTDTVRSGFGREHRGQRTPSSRDTIGTAPPSESEIDRAAADLLPESERARPAGTR